MTFLTTYSVVLSLFRGVMAAYGRVAGKDKRGLLKCPCLMRLLELLVGGKRR